MYAFRFGAPVARALERRISGSHLIAKNTV